MSKLDKRRADHLPDAYEALGDAAGVIAQLKAENARLAAELHGYEAHPDYEYTRSIEGCLANTHPHLWERNPEKQAIEDGTHWYWRRHKEQA